jgi:hypothetical protein
MRRFPILLTLCLGLGALASAAQAQRMPVPAKLQGAILGKVLRFDRTLQESGAPPRVLIAYAGSVPEWAIELLEGFGAAQVPAETVEVTRLEERVAELSVVYVSSDVDPVKVAAGIEGRRVLVVTGIPAWVREGRAAVGIDSREGKPRVVVSQSRLQASGHQLSADLLALAELVP